MERLNERVKSAKKALIALDEVLNLPYSKIIRDAAIQRFEFTLEAIWKLAQRYLILNEGLTVGSPKGVIRACFQSNLIKEPETEILLASIDDRNLTVHTYNEELAEKIYKNIFTYYPLFIILYHSIEKNIPHDND